MNGLKVEGFFVSHFIEGNHCDRSLEARSQKSNNLKLQIEKYVAIFTRFIDESLPFGSIGLPYTKPAVSTNQGSSLR